MIDLPPTQDQLGQVSPSRMAAMSGVEFFEQCMTGETPLPTICGTVPMRVKAVEVGRIVWETTPSEGLLNPMGAVHGGYAMTVLDSCLGCAVHSALEAGRAYSTVEVKVNLVKGIKPADGPFFAEGKVIQVGSRIATAEGRLTDGAGKLYAFGSTTCLLFDVG